MRSAMLALKKKDYITVIKLAEKAKLWPVNLGVGRPSDVDERLEDYILYSAYLGKGNKKMAAKFAENVMEYQHPGFKNENSEIILSITNVKRKWETN